MMLFFACGIAEVTPPTSNTAQPITSSYSESSSCIAVCVYVCTHAHMHMSAMLSETEVSGSPRDEVIGGCELPSVGTGT